MAKSKDEILPIGFIYKLSSPDGSLVYYGSTKNFEKRFQSHIYKYNSYLNKNSGSSYYASFEIIKLGTYNTEVIGTFYHISRCNLQQKEYDYITHNDCLNEKGKSNTEVKRTNNKKYREKHIDEIREYDKKYRENNKEKLYEKKNKKHICDICKEHFTHSNKSRHQKSYKHLAVLQNQVNNLQTQVKKIKMKPKIIQQPISIGNNNHIIINTTTD